VTLAVVDLAVLADAGVISQPKGALKVLGKGELAKKITVKAAIFSASAKEKTQYRSEYTVRERQRRRDTEG